jgi:hypothetical protein
MSPRTKLLRPAAVCLIALALAACASSGNQAKTQLSEEKMIQLNSDVTRKAKARIAMAVDKMRDNTSDPEVQRRAIQLQLAVIAGTRYVRSIPDPRAGMLEFWARAHQMLETVESDFAAEFYGDQRQIVLKASEDVVAIANNAALQVLGPKRYAEILPQIEDYASKHTLVEEVKVGKSSDSGFLQAGGSAVGWVLNLPMKPFALGEGVGETAHSIQNVAEVADRAVDVIDDYPEEVKLQLDLFLLDLERVRSLQRIIDDMGRVTTSIEGFEKTAANLPAEVGKEVTLVLDEIDAKQKDLQQTLADAQGLVAETNDVISGAKQAIDGVNQAVVQTKVTAESLDPVLTNLTAAGQAWEATANAVTKFIVTVEGPEEEETSPKPVPAEPAGSGDTIVDIGNSAEKLTATAVQLRGLTENLQAIIASPDLTKRLEDVDGLAAGTVNHITWRMIQLFVAFFGLMFGYKLAARKFLR